MTPLEYIKSKHNGEIPYRYGANECAKLMQGYAHDVVDGQIVLNTLRDLASQIRFQKALGLLRDLADAAGEPLDSYREEWEAILDATHKFLSEHKEI
jgi:hypothetical protein